MAMLLFLFLISVPAFADQFGFTYISNNTDLADDVAGQFLVDVTDLGSNKVLFTFSNIGTIRSSICDIYFDDNGVINITTGPTVLLAEIISVTSSSSGVSFNQDAKPGDLPEGNTINFFTTGNGVEEPIMLNADSNSPTADNGIKLGESLEIICSLLVGKSFADVITAINNTDLRMGLHVQAIDGGDSDSFVNTSNTNPVPEPATMLLLGSGLIGLASFGRRKFKKN